MGILGENISRRGGIWDFCDGEVKQVAYTLSGDGVNEKDAAIRPAAGKKWLILEIGETDIDDTNLPNYYLYTIGGASPLGDIVLSRGAMSTDGTYPNRTIVAAVRDSRRLECTRTEYYNFQGGITGGVVIANGKSRHVNVKYIEKDD